MKSMTDSRIAHGTSAKLGHVDGDLRVGKRATIAPADGKVIVVTGNVYFEGPAQVNSNLECNSVYTDHFGVIRINGDLTVHDKLDIIHTIEVTGTTRAREIMGEGKIRSDSVIAKRIRVNGVMEVKNTLESEETTEVIGKLNASGQVKLRDFGISGIATFGGGEITGSVQVRGKLAADSNIEFGTLHILGSAKLANCEGRRLSTFGKLAVRGDAKFDDMEVQGSTSVEGNCNSQRAWIRGKLAVSGSFSASETLQTFGTTEIGQRLEGGNMHVGGRLSAKEAILSGEADIAGRLETKQGLKAKKVMVRSGSTCDWPIVADTVEVGASYMGITTWESNWLDQSASIRLIGKESKVQDIYATNVHLGAASSAGRIFAQNIQLEKGCKVQQITYTGELRLPAEGPGSIYINRQPEKVDKLPTPPL